MERKIILFYLAMFLLIFIFAVAATYIDYDIWARLIAGMGVIEGGQVLKEDFLSYTPVHTWFDHEWGSGVIFYLFLKLFGPYSLIILHALLMFGIFFFASKVVKIRYKNPYNIMFYFFAFMAIQQILSVPVRCHMFSFLFFTIFIYLLEKVRNGNNKLLYLIPIIVIFWNNIHGGVVSGIGLLLMYALGEFLNGKPFTKYLITFAASSIVLLINPWGHDYIKFLIMANTMERRYITEWWNIFSQPYLHKWFEFKIFLFATIAVEGISIFNKIKLEKFKEIYLKADKVKYIMLFTTMYLAITHLKLTPFFVIATICFVYEDFYNLIEKIKFPQWKDKTIYTLIFSLGLINFLIADFTVPLGLHIYPVKEVEFIKQNNLKGKLLINFGYGSFASYKLYPNNLIFMDGRYEEVYYDYMLPMLKVFHLVEGPQWDICLDLFKPDIMVIEKSYPVFSKLQTLNEWKLIYEGELFGVFIDKNQSNREFILPSNDLNYYKNTLFDTEIDIRSIIKK